MQISKETLTVLKNFASISTHMLFREGNVLAVISQPNKDIFAKVAVEEQFPKRFAVYDLNQFLGTLSLFPDCTLEFGEKSLLIKSGKQKTEYFYTNEENIVAAPDRSLPTEGITSFTLTDKDLTAAMKAAAVLDAPDISIIGDGSTVTIKVSNRQVNRTSNSFVVEVGETDAVFAYYLKVENLKMLPDNYTVNVCKGPTAKFLYLAGQKRKSEYWLAVDPKSTIS